MPIVVPPEIIARNKSIAEDRRLGRKSLGQLAQEHGITRERVRQIALKNGVGDAKAAAKEYAHNKNAELHDQLEQMAPTILMQYIAGLGTAQIADATQLPARLVQSIIDEQVTDEIFAARSANRNSQRFPDAARGPRDNGDGRQDRYWTGDKVFQALVEFARSQGGRLPTSTKYQHIAPGRDDLPSFATVRNRLGRWSDVRVKVHNSI